MLSKSGGAASGAVGRLAQPWYLWRGAVRCEYRRYAAIFSTELFEPFIGSRGFKFFRDSRNQRRLIRIKLPSNELFQPQFAAQIPPELRLQRAHRDIRIPSRGIHVITRIFSAQQRR